MQIRVEIGGIDGIKSKLGRMHSELSSQAARAALNKVGDKARTEMTRAISDEYNIKSSEVRSKMRISRASFDNLAVVLDPFASGRKGRALNLIHFLDRKATVRAAREAKRAGKKSATVIGGKEMPLLYFKIKKNEPSKPIEGAFLGNQGRTVFVRVGKSRLPIKPLNTIGVPQMFNARKITARVIARINKELPVEVDRAIKAVIARHYGK